MIEVVVERGYDAVTVRELARRAAVSTRAFYQHYSGKEECVLRTHELIVRRVLRSLTAWGVSRGDQKECLRHAVEALLDEWSRDPGGARLMLIDVYTAGPRAVEQARWAIRMIEEALGECLRYPAGGVEVPARLTKGIFAGLAGVVRSRLLASDGRQLADLNQGLARWAASYISPIVAQLEKLDRLSAAQDDRGHSLRSVQLSGPDEEGEMAPTLDRALLLSAASKLAAADGLEKVTSKEIAAVAGVSQRRFHANFASVADCLVAVFELQIRGAVASAKQVSVNNSKNATNVYQVVSVFSAQLARDTVFSSLCFGGVATFGASGIRLQEGLLSEVSSLVEGQTPLVSNADALVIDASVAGFWGALESEVCLGQDRQCPHIAATLTYLLLAPTVGPSRAIDPCLRGID